MLGNPGSTGRIRAAFRSHLIGALLALAALATLGGVAAVAAPPPDGRTYELVTPGQTGRNAMLQPLISADGNRVSYGALSGHGGAHSNVLNTYVATRNADGTWTNRVLQRPQRNAAGPLGWSPVDSADEDLSSVIAQGLAGFSAGVFPYVRFDATGNPVETLIDGRADARYSTSTPDLQRSWFHLADPVPGQPDSPFGQTLYEVDNGTATNVGLLPDGTVHECGAVLSTDFVAPHRQHNVSSDGARIYFHSPDPNAFDCTDPTPDPVRLYSRAGGTTIPISQPPAGEDEFGARFVQATPDGSTVFFQTASQMVDGDTDTGEDLYRFDLGGDYTCLSCVDGGPPANLSFGTAVVSEDGSHAYFVSNSNLVDDPDLTPDVSHIYVNDGSGIEFVANTGQLGAAPNNFPRGQISEDGSVLFISTNEQLTDFATNNNTALYRYTADSGELECVTCVFEPYDTPVDMTANTFGGSLARAASDDGSMLFFTTRKGIAPEDTNQALDVYRWKEGEGVALVTDGVSQTSGFSPNHAFGGTDASGANAVFTAFEALVPQHIGGIQIYTARIGGRFSPFPPPHDPGCSGDGCQGNPAPQPGVTDPGSATLNGPGNVTPSKPKAKKKPKKCRKGFVRKRVRGKVRCVRRKPATRRSRRAAERRKAAALRRIK